MASKEAGDDVSDAEHAIIGMTHAMLGARVASYWQLPESLVDSILRHECAMDFAGEPTLLSIQVGSVAATYASGTATDINVEEILAWLQLTDEGWQEIVEVVEGRTQAASEFLGVLFA